MVSLLGWINIGLLVMMGSIYPIKNRYLKTLKSQGKEKAKTLGLIYGFSRKAHPVTGILILVIGFYHGSQAFSLTVVHTGTLLLYGILLMGLIAIIGQKLKPLRKHWRKVHRILGVVVFVFAALHVFWRNIL